MPFFLEKSRFVARGLLLLFAAFGLLGLIGVLVPPTALAQATDAGATGTGDAGASRSLPNAPVPPRPPSGRNDGGASTATDGGVIPRASVDGGTRATTDAGTPDDGGAPEEPAPSTGPGTQAAGPTINIPPTEAERA